MKRLLVVEQATPIRDQLIINLQGSTKAEITLTDDYARALILVARGGFDAALIALNFANDEGLKTFKTLRHNKVIGTKLILMSTGEYFDTLEAPTQNTEADALIEKSQCTSHRLRQLFQSLNLV